MSEEMRVVESREIFDKKFRGYTKSYKTIFGNTKWIYVIESYFMTWREYYISGRYKTEQEAKDACNEWLDGKEFPKPESKKYV